jgi:hypothetical protein
VRTQTGLRTLKVATTREMKPALCPLSYGPIRLVGPPGSRTREPRRYQRCSSIGIRRKMCRDD